MLNRELLDDIYCQGVSFIIADEDKLAQTIALVLVQEYTLAKDIIAGKVIANKDAKMPIDKDEIEDIITRRLKPPVDYHRDGFLFQLIMWLAAHYDLDDGDLVALPHTQASEKGQDSLIVHRADKDVVALSICEDKATENPRATIRDKVWPEIKDYEAGGRRDELRSNIIATLGLSGMKQEEAISLVRCISWEKSRRYRVRVTLEKERDEKLFKGFNELVPGRVDRRRGETVQIPQLREWMTNFANKVEMELRKCAKKE